MLAFNGNALLLVAMGTEISKSQKLMGFKGRKPLQSHRVSPDGASTRQRWAFLEKTCSQVILGATQQAGAAEMCIVLLSKVRAGAWEGAGGELLYTQFTLTLHSVYILCLPKTLLHGFLPETRGSLSSTPVLPPCPDTPPV